MVGEAIFFLVLGALIILLNVRSRSMATARLYAWAAKNNLWLVEVEERWFMRGPFFFTTTIGQRVYRVRVKYSEGDVRLAWIRIGGIFRGMFSPSVDVRWDMDRDSIAIPSFVPPRAEETKNA
jgi:hypothetical protein